MSDADWQTAFQTLRCYESTQLKVLRCSEEVSPEKARIDLRPIHPGPVNNWRSSRPEAPQGSGRMRAANARLERLARQQPLPSRQGDARYQQVQHSDGVVTESRLLCRFSCFDVKPETCLNLNRWPTDVDLWEFLVVRWAALCPRRRRRLRGAGEQNHQGSRPYPKP
jgi:hypothetical protein